MNATSLLVLCSALTVLGATGNGPAVFDFEGDEPGAVPAGFSPALSGEGRPSVWKVSAAAWNELRVDVAGELFTVYLNGKALFDVEDSTFSDAGRVGLWTKADSVTWFDDLRVTVNDAAGTP